MKIYTKTGDDGTTSLIGGVRVLKCDNRVEAYGTIDELDAYIGLIRSFCLSDISIGCQSVLKLPADTIELLSEIRKALFVACSFVACCSIDAGKKLKSPDYSIIEKLENAIDNISRTLPKDFAFTILGNDIFSCQINVARTVCRRAERRVVAIEGDVAEQKFIMPLLNRISDYLYVLLRCSTVGNM